MAARARFWVVCLSLVTIKLAVAIFLRSSRRNPLWRARPGRGLRLGPLPYDW